MGCFNVSCAFTKLSIREGDKCVLIPLFPRIHYCQIYPTSSFLNVDACLSPFCFPIKGEYNDYGSICNIEHNKNTEAIERFLGISIEDFVAIITEDREVFSCMGHAYEVFFNKKEIMKRNVSFEDFLLQLGFIKEGTTFRINNDYTIDCIDDKYVINHEKGKYYSLDYDGKVKLLNFHYDVFKQYLGVRNSASYDIIKQISAMFILRDVYDYYMELPTPKHFPYTIKMNTWLAFQLGFTPKSDENYDILVKTVNDKLLTLKIDYNCTLNDNVCYDLTDFLDAYKEITKEKIDISNYKKLDFVDYIWNNCYLVSNKNYEIFKTKKDTYKRLATYMTQFVDKPVFSDCEYFKNWKYFFEIYKEVLLKGEIENEYKEYHKLIIAMNNSNIMFFPTFCSSQGNGNSYENKLSKVTSMIIRKRKKELE